MIMNVTKSDSSGLATSFIILLSYTLSAATYDRVRPSLFVSQITFLVKLTFSLHGFHSIFQEVLFNTIVCAVYIAASSLLAMQVYMQVTLLKSFLHRIVLSSLLFLVFHICFLQLLYYYRVIPGFSIYPALTAAYVSQ